MSLIKWTPRSTELSPFVGNSMLNDIDQFINSFFNEKSTIFGRGFGLILLKF